MGTEKTSGTAAMGVHVGWLVEHGAAPDHYVRGASMSYVVVLQTKEGRRALWNPELHKALHATRAQVGDRVTIFDKGPVSARANWLIRRETDALPPNRDRASRWLILPEAKRLRVDSREPRRVGPLLNELAPRIAARSMTRIEDRTRFVATVASATAESRRETEREASVVKNQIEHTLALRAQQLRTRPIAPTFDADHFREIHVRLFTGLAVDPGRFRTAELASSIVQVPIGADPFHGSIKESAVFAASAAFRRLAQLRPFNYGVLPTTMVYVEQLAKQRGFELNLFDADRQQLVDSLRMAVTSNDMVGLRQLFREKTRPILSLEVQDQALFMPASPDTAWHDLGAARPGRQIETLSRAGRAHAQTSRGSEYFANSRQLPKQLAYER